MTPTVDCDQSINAVQLTAGVAGTPAATVTDYNNRAANIKSTVLSEYDRIWLATLSKEVAAVSAFNFATGDVDALYTTFRTDCVAAQKELNTASKTANDALAKLTVDATVPLTAAPTIQAAIFERGIFDLNNLNFDGAVSQMDQVILSDLRISNNKQMNALRLIANGVIGRINQNPSNRRTAMNKIVNDAVLAFNPPDTAADVSKALLPLRPAVDAAIDALRPLSPAEVRTGAIPAINDYSKKANDAYVAMRAQITTNFNAAVTKINSAMTPGAAAGGTTTNTNTNTNTGT